MDSIITAVDPPKHDDVTRTVIARPGAPEASADDDRAHYLVVVEGDGAGRRFEVGGENLVVGRTKPADIVVSDVLASRNHCRVGLVMGELFVTDLGSSNGTYVAGKRINKAIVSAGERITIDLDGQQVTDFDPKSAAIPARKNWPEPKREPKRPEAGYIALQKKYGPDGLVIVGVVQPQLVRTSAICTSSS